MFKIIDVVQSDYQNYTDVYFKFEMSIVNSHLQMFEMLRDKFRDDHNLNFRRYDNCVFDYYNHCVKGCVTDGCIYELQSIKNGKTYPTKDVESVIYKIIQTLELFSH